LACASKPDNLDELTTYSEIIEISNISQMEVFIKTNDAFRGFKNIKIQSSDENSGIIKGKLVVDGITHGDQILRYNSLVTVAIKDRMVKITFNEPTIQNIGYVSEQAKENAFRNYMMGYRTVPTVGQPKTNEQLRMEWEQKNVFSSNNPGNERPVQYDYQIKNVQQQWENLIKELRRAVNTY